MIIAANDHRLMFYIYIVLQRTVKALMHKNGILQRNICFPKTH